MRSLAAGNSTMLPSIVIIDSAACVVAGDVVVEAMGTVDAGGPPPPGGDDEPSVERSHPTGAAALATTAESTIPAQGRRIDGPPPLPRHSSGGAPWCRWGCNLNEK